MKRFVSILGAVILVNAIGIGASAETLEQRSAEEKILYDFWTANGSEVRTYGESRVPDDAFVADIDNDAEPELLVYYSYLGPGGPSIAVYKNSDGEVSYDGGITTSSGTGMDQELSLVMQDNGDLKAIEYLEFYPSSEMAYRSAVLFQYNSEENVIERFAGAEYFEEIGFHDYVTGDEMYGSVEEVDDCFEAFYSSIRQNVVFSSKDENDHSQDFFEIWDKQKELRQEITVQVNNQKVGFDQPPVIVDGRTMVPLRAIFEALGAEVDWDANTQTVSATKGAIAISLQIGSSAMYVNGEEKALDVPAKIVGGRTLVPVRAISEAFNCAVSWDGETKTVIIND